MKRTVSMLIILSLVFSLFPASVFAVTEDTGYKINYEIGKYMQEGTVFTDLTYEKTGGYWEYHSNSLGMTSIGTSGLVYAGGNGITINTNAWIAFKINIPVAGYYKAKVKYGTFTGGKYGRVRLLPATADIATYAGASTNTTYLLSGGVSCAGSTASVTWGGEAALGNLACAGAYMQAGEYILIYEATHNKSGNRGPAALGDITFYTVEYDGATTVTEFAAYTSAYVGAVSISDSELEVGETAQASATVTDSITHKAVAFTYASSDDTVATVDAQTGEVTAIKEGTATIYVAYEEKVEGNIVGSEICIIPKTEPPLTLSGIREDYSFITRSSAWSKEVSPYDDVIIDNDIRGITYEYTAEDGNGNWEWNSAGMLGGEWTPAPSVVCQYNGVEPSGRLSLWMQKNEWVAFNIKVPKAGIYSTKMEYSAYNKNCGVAAVYLMPKDTADINSSFTAENLLGTVDFNDSTLVTDTIKLVRLNDITFEEEGEYLLVMRQARNGYKYLRLRAFVIDGINSMREIFVTADKQELTYGDSAQISVSATRFDGTTLLEDEYMVSYESQDRTIAVVDNSGKVTAVGDGTVQVEITATDGIETITSTVTFNVIDDTGIKTTELKLPNSLLYINEVAQITLIAHMNSGNKINVPLTDAEYAYGEDGIVAGDGAYVKGVRVGKTSLVMSVDWRGTLLTVEADFEVISDPGKSESTIYTDEIRNTAAENIKKYSWAKTEAKSVLSAADGIIENFDKSYSFITGEGIPRSRQIGYRNDAEYTLCRYCGESIVTKYGGNGVGGYNIDKVNRPWKLQCPDCKRLFPSNDFESFLELGLDKQGYFSLDRAYEKHKQLFAEEYAASGYADQGYGYLKNDLYPELSESSSELYNVDPLRKVWVDGNLWCVDDSMGYIPRDENGLQRKATNGVAERQGYIAMYNMLVWYEVSKEVETLANAYVYTGDEKYGRAGAILLDRIADVYPSFDLYPYMKQFYNTHGGSGFGSIVGCVDDCPFAERLSRAADAFYPMLTEPSVISALSEAAETFDLENRKDTSKKIWQNWENGILKHTFTMAKDNRIYGNIGMMHAAVAAAAVALDNEPESQEMLDWLYKTGNGNVAVGHAEGGELAVHLVEGVDRDGHGYEASPYYNTIWITNLSSLADILSRYEGKKEYSLYNNPKYIKMFQASTETVLAGTHQAQTGDSAGVASIGMTGQTKLYLDAFEKLKDTPIAEDLARFIYQRLGVDLKGAHYGILIKDPERAEEEIGAFVGDSVFQESDLLSGYGLAVLREGADYSADTQATAKNNQRDFWMFFGGAKTSHGHYDTLEIGMEAYGLNFAPDLGYPENTGNDPNRLQWVSATISHNVVAVDERNQDTYNFTGTPLHFDDSGKVKLMDVDGNGVYENTENYRRTLVMVEANDDVSYGVDFFRVTGGDAHTFSFHAQSDNATAVDGVEFTPQVDENGDYVGTYAGRDVPYGEDPDTTTNSVYETKYPRGYTWMTKVRKDEDPEAVFSVEFEITDFRKVLTDSKGLRLRLTQMNNFTPDEVSLVAGMVPRKTVNEGMPDNLEYVISQRRGENLDSLFTTVYEPYKESRYLESVEPCDVSGEVSEDNVVKAVKVTHKNGRTDYIVYATDKTKIYRIADLFDFRGFIGVYSVNADGKVIYRYVNDGDIIGEATGEVSMYSGTVADFQHDLSLTNYIDVNMKCDDTERLIGKAICIDNDGVQNGVYHIEGAETIGEEKVRLDIGTVSVVRGYADKENLNVGYVYNIGEGQTFTIPASFVDDSSPVFDTVLDLTTSAGSSITTKVNAISPLGAQISYKAITLPRGASFNSDTGELTWKPDSSQVGDSHVSVTATDEDGRESSVHFTITVYGSTTDSSSGNDSTETPSGNTGTSGTPAGGGGGGGGGASDTGNSSDNTDATDDEGTALSDEKDNADGTDNTDVGNGVYDVPQFTDITNHAWATDAINALASDGIIRGTTTTTFSPANNITRADFALLLVRAFKLESDNTENFTDVEASDYFAPELAIARNTGIVNGIGDNRYAPRNTITRQDMMVIVYRALQTLNAGFGIYDEPKNEDYTTVADYAKEAVTALIGAGLVNGRNGQIAPTDHTTRAEVAVLLMRILDYIK